MTIKNCEKQKSKYDSIIIILHYMNSWSFALQRTEKEEIASSLYSALQCTLIALPCCCWSSCTIQQHFLLLIFISTLVQKEKDQLYPVTRQDKAKANSNKTMEVAVISIRISAFGSLVCSQF